MSDLFDRLDRVTERQIGIFTLRMNVPDVKEPRPKRPTRETVPDFRGKRGDS